LLISKKPAFRRKKRQPCVLMYRDWR